MSEIWIAVDNSPYEVSNYGRLRSTIPLMSGFRKVPAGTFRKYQKDKDGYLKTTIRRTDGKLINIFPHRLVAHYFLGPRPVGKQVNHKDGNKNNNQSTNLEYTSNYKNSHHAMILGLRPSKLNKDDVAEIRRCGEPQYKLAERFSVNQSHISRIKSGKCWAGEGVTN